jgi:predicted GIY-YIG superfamily endonuclease
MRQKRVEPNSSEVLVNEIFGYVVANPWHTRSYTLDDCIDRPTPKCLVRDGWKVVTKEGFYLPHKPGIYIIHCGEKDNPNLYLYVGQALDLQKRLSSHPQLLRARREYTAPLIFFWDFLKVQKQDLLRFEAYMIGVANPIWNFGSPTETYEGISVTFDGIWH